MTAGAEDALEALVLFVEVENVLRALPVRIQTALISMVSPLVRPLYSPWLQLDPIQGFQFCSWEIVMPYSSTRSSHE
jgi:hypothetical protein